jgi:hypothetical protein
MIINKKNSNDSQLEHNYINIPMSRSERLKSIIIHVFKAVFTFGIYILFSSYRSTFYNEILNGQRRVSFSTLHKIDLSILPHLSIDQIGQLNFKELNIR